MGSTTAPIIYKYPLDLTGVSPTNRVIGELHDLSTNPNRALVPDYGAFYTDGLVLVDQANGRILDRDTDFLAVQTDPDATAASGKEVCSIILIINGDVSNHVLFTGQMVGGEYSNYVYALQQMIENLQLDNRPIIWGEIIGTPSAYPPSPHLHSINDTYGWEVLADAINTLRQAILTGDQAAFDALRQSLFSELLLYEPTLGYVPVEQGVSLLDGDPGKIILKADGDGNILGYLNNTLLGQVLFSSSQINDVITDLQQRVSVLESADDVQDNRLSTLETKVNTTLPKQLALANASILANQQAINELAARVQALEDDVTFTPKNISPADGSIGVVVQPTLVGDGYYPKYGIPQQYRTFQIVDATGDFSTPVYATSVSTTSGAVLQHVVATPLDSNQSYKWRYQDKTIKDQFGSWSPATYFSTSATYVAAPTITSPATGAVNVGARPTITLNAFSVVGTTDTQASLTVEIYNNTTGALVWSNTTAGTGNSVVVASNTLAPNTKYKVRARYTGTTLGASAWSAYNTFTTATTFVQTPTVTAPVNNSTISTDQPTITLSAFAVTAGTDTLKSTSVRIKNANGTVVWSVNNSTSQLNNFVVPYGILSGNSTYTVQGQYTGNNYGTSNWSSPVTFTVAASRTTSINTLRATTETAAASRQTTTSYLTTYTTAVSGTTSIATSKVTQATTSFITYYNTSSAHNTSVALSKNTTTTWTSSHVTSRTTIKSTYRTSTVISAIPKSRTTTTYFQTSVTVCVAEGTMITLPDGSQVPVQSLYKGATLRSLSLPNLEPETVEDYADYSAPSLDGAEIATTNIHAFQPAVVRELYNIFVEGKDRPIRVTPEHPFMIQDVDGTVRFCKAELLNTDDMLVTGKLQFVKVVNVEREYGRFTIYKIDCMPLDLFIHDDLVGHNLKFDEATGTSFPPYQSYFQTSATTTTSWTSYVTHFVSVVFNTSYTTSFATAATLSRSTVTSYTSIRSTISSKQTSRTTTNLTNITTSYTVTTTYVGSRNTSITTSLQTTTSWTTSYSTNTTVITSGSTGL